MIFIVNILDRRKNPLYEVLLSAPSKRELRFRLADLVDCVEVNEDEYGDWELKGIDVNVFPLLDMPFFDGSPAGQEPLDYCDDACLYATTRELTVEELEEYLRDGKQQEEYMSILKCHLYLRSNNG